ncbi:N-acetyltransferase [Ochrobactrum sp. MYb15]|uniref:GNAT family N-acetyltransferase n=1 Tax=Brucella TaxID=234 RepID=UPI0004654B4E|nr:GNAT family N-acetyltransferase [Brucella rhizosphaerae]PQZ51382.1 N-acetyltransferase [Ochrobactrum sp. MYb19]PRA56050.1 N-acetyltransferase [Ochrobactrum sp. MYb68]PRA65584.1 N-acetyltransferase [Ochrobactrum sp. MYb18]PRA77274.1 N-acetyltransferase [Brucella thiophenivorans]PRA93091.1 N-acetyltransferase [Ochrobactrum sp. MYb14]PRA99284.1 N-acetyltransferase [Ochrobactrum sp. MYb15]
MSENIQIRKSDNTDSGRYFVVINGDEAEMTYTKLGPALISIDHTFVPDSMRGKGVAQALALNAVEDARKTGWKIVPRCSFMQAQVKRYSDWSDVIETE